MFFHWLLSIWVYCHTDQAHSPQDGDAVDALEPEVEKAGHHDHQVKDVPAVPEVLPAQGTKLQHSLQGEEGGENLVTQVKNVGEILAHSMMLNGQEDSVEDDAEGDEHVKAGVIDNGVEDVLGLEPAVVVEAAGAAAGAVTVRRSLDGHNKWYVDLAGLPLLIGMLMTRLRDKNNIYASSIMTLSLLPLMMLPGCSMLLMVRS